MRSLVVRQEAAGPHSVVWDARDDRGRPVTSGVYFIRLETGTGVQTRKAVLLK